MKISGLVRLACLALAISISLLSLPPRTAHLQQDPPEVSVEARPNMLASPRASVRPTRADLASVRRGISIQGLGISRQLEAIDLSSHRPSNPNEIGVGRKVDEISTSLGRAFAETDGSSVRLISIRSPGALELRVHLEDFDLPPGDAVYIYGLDEKGPIAGPYTGRGPIAGLSRGKDDREFWSDTIPGETVIIEHQSRGEERPFRIAGIVHNYQAFLAPVSPNLLNCHVDANCTTDLLNDSVAKISYISGGNSFFCSGTMMNNQSSDFAPYFLTARHCISTAAAAETVQAQWFYRSTLCNSGIGASGVTSPTGATLLNAESSSDQALLRILYEVPSLVYSGWTSAAQTVTTGVYGLHHPAGSFLRRSTGNITSTTSACPPTGLVNGYNIAWTAGVIEPGSSGSGLFLNNGSGHLVGIDSCGELDGNGNFFCGGLAWYGRFSDFFSDISDFLIRGDEGLNPLNHTIGTTINASLTTGNSRSRVGGVDFYAQTIKFNAQAGDAVQINLTSAQFDTVLAVLGPRQNLIGFNDDIGFPNTNSQLNLILPETGEYLIEVSTYNSNVTGSYQLTSQFIQVFADVLLSNFFHRFIHLLRFYQITQGCGANLYCPSQNVTREQMAAFIIRALGEFNPPTPPFQRFADVPPSNFFYAFIEQMALRGITTGCPAPLYCPTQNVTREQMAAFIIRALGEFNPPTPALQRFLDVPSSNFFYAFIEQMALRGITTGCPAPNYCPTQSVTREQMAAFLVRAFIL